MLKLTLTANVKQMFLTYCTISALQNRKPNLADSSGCGRNVTRTINTPVEGAHTRCMTVGVSNADSEGTKLPLLGGGGWLCHVIAPSLTVYIWSLSSSPKYIRKQNCSFLKPDIIIWPDNLVCW